MKRIRVHWSVTVNKFNQNTKNIIVISWIYSHLFIVAHLYDSKYVRNILKRWIGISNTPCCLHGKLSWKHVRVGLSLNGWNKQPELCAALLLIICFVKKLQNPSLPSNRLLKPSVALHLFFFLFLLLNSGKSMSSCELPKEQRSEA